MTFLNPLVLFGLIAASIPIILHLLNLRQLRTVEFSTLRFLKELQQTKIRRLRVRQLLLLLIRTLLVLLIVFAFARPALRGSIFGRLGGNAHSTVVFILDDSFSMGVHDSGGERFSQAIARVHALIDVLTDGDEAFLIKLSDLPAATVDPATHDFAALRTLVSEARISPIRRPLENALRLSARLLEKTSNVNKEIYIISDFQQTLFSGHPPRDAAAAAAQFFDERTHLFLINLGGTLVPNTALDSVDVLSRLFEKDKPVSLSVSARNYNSSALANSVLSVFLDGARSAQTNVQIGEWGSATTTISVAPKRAGFIPGYIELENDALELDNRRYFTMYVPESLKVALVSSSQENGRYLSLALLAGMDDSSKSLLAVENVTPEQLPFLNLKSFDALLLAEMPALGAAALDRIGRFIREGGGLILFPGSNFTPEPANAFLASLSLPPVESVNGKAGTTSTRSFQRVDLDHPLFETLFETSPKTSRRAPTIESPAISMSLQRSLGAQGRAIITMNDGTPFLSEHTLGAGKILFYSVAPSLRWSDLPLKGAFVPLMYRSVIYTASGTKPTLSYIAGDEPMIQLRDVARTVANEQFVLMGPGGLEERLSPAGESAPAGDAAKNGAGGRAIASRSIVFSAVRLADPGVYEVRQGKNLLTTLAVNPDNRESDLRQASAEEMVSLWERLGIAPGAIRQIESVDQLHSTVMESRFGIELWKYCLAAALLLALAEMFVARDSRKEMQSLMSGASA